MVPVRWTIQHLRTVQAPPVACCNVGADEDRDAREAHSVRDAVLVQQTDVRSGVELLRLGQRQRHIRGKK